MHTIYGCIATCDVYASLDDRVMYRVPASGAAQMDPQQRLLLEAAAEVMLGTQTSSGPSGQHNIATYIGISWTEYAAIATAHGVPTGAFSAQSAVLSVSVGKRVAEALT